MSLDWRDFQGVNAGYAEELYDKFLADPLSVDPDTRALFRVSPPPRRPAPPPTGDVVADMPAALNPNIVVGARDLAQAIRRYGHLAAHIDPLGSRPLGDHALLPESHGVTEADLRALPASIIAGPVAEGAETMWDVIERLKAIYCSTTGYDFAHIFVPDERHWLREAVERGRYRAPADPIDPIALLDRLTDVEVFERFLHRTFPGKTRFSIEGLDMLVPVLDEVIAEAAEAGMRQAFIGMAHRGRLNVMAHVIGKPYAQILAEFKDPVRNGLALEGVQWSGDVKYHLGASRAIGGGERVEFVVSMPPNPSHLEAIDPVLEGMARAAGTDASAPGAPRFNPDAVLPILIHGDASFAGQGIVAETLNLHRLAGYTTGGTVHIIANNQIGFTTDPHDSFSTLYASGLARGYKIPIVHVNADDPEACVAAVRLAFGYRARFHRDVLIDLVGYRRYGHNEGDEPAFTQPAMYRKIAEQPTVREMWARTLESRGVIESGYAQTLSNQRMDALQATYDALDPEKNLVEAPPEVAAPGTAAQTRTAVPIERLRALNDALLVVPDGFTVNRKLERSRDRRRQAFDAPAERTIDWAAAEELALASVLEDGTPIRLTGEDVERGTFSHRHAVLFDANTGARFAPLEALRQARASFEIRNSPLSENAAVGFEYGYDIQAPDRLVIWEAQYGDFVNGAQPMLDEFVLSARAKWGQEPSLVMLLPHAYEGQGPDHASARPERFLQLAADINMRVVNCTTAAQYFHVLRRQAALLVKDPLPLIVLTPKGLLRHPAVASSPRELAEGRWMTVIDDEEAKGRADEIRRLVFCTGKVAVDLLTSPKRADARAVAVCRVEQLYPLPINEMVTTLDRYPHLEEVLWVQEEPENMGAWDFVRPALEGLVGTRRLAANTLLIPDMTEFSFIPSGYSYTSIDVPCHIGGMTEGTVTRKTQDDESGQGGVKIHFRNKSGKIFSVDEVFSDGSYYYNGLPVGEYEAYVDSLQLAILKCLSIPRKRILKIIQKEEGDFISNVDFKLVPFDLADSIMFANSGAKYNSNNYTKLTTENDLYRKLKTEYPEMMSGNNEISFPISLSIENNNDNSREEKFKIERLADYLIYNPDSKIKIIIFCGTGNSRDDIFNRGFIHAKSILNFLTSKNIADDRILIGKSLMEAETGAEKIEIIVLEKRENYN